jgi:uncharacterized protein
MAAINEDMRDVVARCGLGYVATVSADGTPNLSPKGSLAVWDDEHLYFADIASPQTVENLRARPVAEVNAIDIIKRRGYRFKGSAEVVDDGPVFERAAEVLKEVHGPQYPCNHAVVIKVDEIRPVRSPAYLFNDPPPDEEKLSAIWRKKLGVGADPDADGPGSAQVDAYEKVLVSLLNFGSVEELRDAFSRQVVIEAADSFADALDATRERDQPDEFALATAVERQVIQTAAGDDEGRREEIDRLFNDPEHHEMPSDELTSGVAAIWERTG